MPDFLTSAVPVGEERLNGIGTFAGTMIPKFKPVTITGLAFKGARWSISLIFCSYKLPGNGLSIWTPKFYFISCNRRSLVVWLYEQDQQKLGLKCIQDLKIMLFERLNRRYTMNIIGRILDLAYSSLHNISVWFLPALLQNHTGQLVDIYMFLTLIAYAQIVSSQ